MSLAASAPLTENQGAVASKVSEVQDQEQELQSLLHLADEQAARSDVTVHEEHVQQVHEVNGHKTEVETERKTVSDNTGKVLADVKQTVSEKQAEAGSASPEVKVKTEVDVPAEGVHETIVQFGAEDDDVTANGGDDAAGAEFSPEVVAEYLYKTGDFDRFYTALAELVNASVMTEAEAESYAQMVALEYDRLQMEEYENSLLVQRRAMVPAGLDMDARFNYPVPMETQDRYPVAVDAPESLYALGQEEARNDLELDPADLLPALWNEAYGLGDERADALVRELFAKVRGDGDPDDEGQVRDILLDLVASSLMEEDAPTEQLLGWQPILDSDAQMDQPINAPFAPQPMEVPAPQPMRVQDDKEAAYHLTEKRHGEEPAANQEAKPANQQPIASSETKQAESQPVAASETKSQGKAEGGEKAPAASGQRGAADVSAEKRAAETV